MLNQLPENTSVMLLAAGHGSRLRPLTDTTPKPLLKVGALSLIEHHLTRLQTMGFQHVVINIAHLAKQITQTLGDGKNYGLNIEYSDESECGALETAGGIINALSLIRSETFISINADIFTDYAFDSLLAHDPCNALLVLVENPPHKPNGDFYLREDGLIYPKQPGIPKTYSGIARYRKSLFTKLKPGKQALRPVFDALMNKQQLHGLPFFGRWSDIGTEKRLAHANELWSTLT